MPRRKPVQSIAANANKRGKNKGNASECEGLNSTTTKLNSKEKSSGVENSAGNGNAAILGNSAPQQPRWSPMDSNFAYLHKKFKKMECVESSNSSSGGEDPTGKPLDQGPQQPPEDQGNSSVAQLALEALFQVTGRELKKINEEPAKGKEVNGGGGGPTVPKNPGRHVCPYCGHGCAKPSILQKHIRAHTNERPYTCEPCGFAFKTTSNLYKHRKSRAHALKLGLVAPSGSVTEEPEEDAAEVTVEEEEEDGDEDHTATQAPIYKPKFHSVTTKRTVGEEEEGPKSNGASVPSLAKRRNDQLQLKLKIPKPPQVVMPLSSTCSTPSSSSSSSSSPSRSPGSSAPSPARTPKFASPEYVQQRISKLISENAAIVEIQDPLWQKRNMRHSSSVSPGGGGQSPSDMRSPAALSPLTPSSLQHSPRTPPMGGSAQVIPKSKLASALLGRATFSPQPATPPLTPASKGPATATPSVIVVNGTVNPVDSSVKSLLLNPGIGTPQNPEGSIIKDLLLKARESGTANTKKLPEQEVTALPSPVTTVSVTDTARHTCASCNMQFQRAENLQAHQSFYCRPQDPQVSGAPTGGKSDCGPPPKARGRPKGSKNRPKTIQEVTGGVRKGLQQVTQTFYEPRGLEVALGVLKSRVGVLPDAISTAYDGPILKRHLLARAGDQSPPPQKKQLKSPSEYGPPYQPYTMDFAAQAQSQLRLFVGGKMQVCTSPTVSLSMKDTFTTLSDGDEGKSMSSPASSGSGTFVQTIAKSVLNSGGTVRQVPDAKDSPSATSTSCMPISSVSSSRTGTLSGGGVVAGDSELVMPPATVLGNALTIPLSIPAIQINTFPIDISHLHINVPESPSSRPNRLNIPDCPKMTFRFGSSSQSSCSSSLSPVSDISPVEPTTPKIAPEPVRPKVPATRPTTLSLRPPDRPMSLTEKFLVSPETPRPKKKYTQSFNNGQHYTYLALKQSTRVFYCCIHWAQPMYVPQSAAPNLSMYSVWKTVPAEPGPLGLNPTEAMALYDSRNRYSIYTMAQMRTPLQVTHSSYWSFKEKGRTEDTAKVSTVVGNSPVAVMEDGDESDAVINVEDVDEEEDEQSDSRWKESAVEVSSPKKVQEDVSETESEETEDEEQSGKPKSAEEDGGGVEPKRVRIFEGGFKSNEDYTYVRGRGRGKYVCEECGIRCKKPSMLKKHIRTHTDVRPYTCKHCNFSFKTKGNLTKHMKSKAHHKKCVELGLDPIPVTIDDSQIDEEALVRQERIERQREHFANDNDEDDDEEEDEDGEEDDEYARNFDYGDEDEDMMEVDGDEDNGSQLSMGQFDDAEQFDGLDRGHPRKMETSHDSAVNSHLTREAAHSLLDLSKPNDLVPPKNSRIARRHKGRCTTTDLPPNNNLINYLPRPGTTVEDREVLIGNPRVVWSVEPPEPIAVQGPPYPPLQIVEDEGAEDGMSCSDYMIRGIGPEGEPEGPLKDPQPKPVLHVGRSEVEMDGDEPMDLSMPQTRHGIPCKVVVGVGGDPYAEEDENFSAGGPWEARNVGAYYPYRPESPRSVCADGRREGGPCYENVMPPNAAEEEEEEEDATLLKGFGGSREHMYISPVYANSRSPEYRRINETVEGSGPWDREQDPESRCVRTYGPEEPSIEDPREKPRNPTRRPSTPEDFHGLPSPPAPTVETVATIPPKGPYPTVLKPPTITTAPQATTTVVSQFGFPLRGSKVNSSTSSTGASEVNAKQMLDYSPAVSCSGLQRSIDDGKCVCSICNKSFSKPSQLRLHVNIHYFERPFRCESCAISFRTKGHLQKHKRSVSHYNKVNMNMTFGTPTSDNPRPFKCADCKIAFRIHGHLAKHLRSKMHIMKLECLGKLPFGTYAEFERSGANLNEIDTTDCDNSLGSLQVMATKFFGRNAHRWPRERMASGCSSDDLSDGVPFADSPVDTAAPHPVQPVIGQEQQTSLVVASGSARRRTVSATEESSVSPDFAEAWSQKLGQECGSESGAVAKSSVEGDFQGFQQQRDVAPTPKLVQDYEDVSDVDSDGGSPTREMFACRICGKVLKSAKFLQVHHYVEHAAQMADGEDPHSEGECSSATVAPPYVVHGARLHSLDCEICGRSFQSRCDLKQHIQTHALPRPFVCHVCDAGFTTAQHLKAHSYTHTRQLQDEPFACSECCRAFDSSASLDSHMVRYHSAAGPEQVR